MIPSGVKSITEPHSSFDFYPGKGSNLKRALLWYSICYAACCHSHPCTVQGQPSLQWQQSSSSSACVPAWICQLQCKPNQKVISYKTDHSSKGAGFRGREEVKGEIFLHLEIFLMHYWMCRNICWEDSQSL